MSSPVLEDLCGIVLADAAEVGGLAGVAEDPLGSTDGVLGGTTYGKSLGIELFSPPYPEVTSGWFRTLALLVTS